MLSSRCGLFLLLTLPCGATLGAQQPDTAQRLPDLGVRASRSSLAPGAAGLSIASLRGDSARRGRASPLLDDLLGFVPGVLARERSDYSLDTRISVRGAGARANFGVRGVRVLIDGVPATLPDGQTPLTSLDLELVERIEVARGPLAALHGNGSLGVVSLTTPARWDTGSTGRVTAEMGFAPGLGRQTVVIGGGGPRVGGLIAGSRLLDRGAREHSRAEQWRFRGAGEWLANDATTVTIRGSWAHDPELQSPGALTLDEFATDPSQSAPNSRNRDAGKQLDQAQLSLGLVHRTGTAVIDANAWTIRRELDNPLAAPAPPPTTATEGTWVGIDRQVIGARTTVQMPLGLRTVASGGIDLQRMLDDRVNRRHDAGVVSGPAFLDQQERVNELGGFGQLIVFAGRGITFRFGGRHDRVGFAVDDHLVATSGGERTMAAWSGGGAIAWRSERFEVWGGVGSAFETPTTTELANRSDGSTGINHDLDPARTRSLESGVRFRGGSIAIEAVGFTSQTTDAITPVAESGGRSFFANVGETTTRGIEVHLAMHPVRHIAMQGSLTALRSRFGAGAVSASGAPITGHAVPGVLPFTARLGATYAHGRVLLDVDHAWSAPVWADDANSVEVPGWGAGVTNAMLRVQPRLGGSQAALRLGVRNLFDVGHATGVVVNGGFGRVVEPGNGRRMFVGFELGGQ